MPKCILYGDSKLSEVKPFIKNFDPKPNILSYGDNKPSELKSFGVDELKLDNKVDGEAKRNSRFHQRGVVISICVKICLFK